METPQETLLMLSGWFLQTLSPDRVPRREAEQRLSEFADKPGFSIAILHLLASPADDQIRLAASVHFKNHLRSRWSPPPDDLPAIPDQEKNKIKELIVPLMLNSPPLIRSQLSECLAVIGKHDFPKLWPQLLPDLVSSLAAVAAPENYNYAVVNGVLTTANSLCKKFRFEYKTNDLLLDLKYCLDKFAAPLLELFLRTGRLIEAQVGANSPPEVLVQLFECQRLCCRIFFSLNFQDLPEFFEDHMKEWMDEFLRYLTAGFPSLENVKAGLEVVDSLRSAICENINLYMEKNEEEFHGYVRDFAFAVFNLLVNVSLSSSRDHLAIMAIKFLTTISTSVEHSLFAAPESLSIICQKIVIPNVRARDEDEELFEMNYVEYIRRDIEGSDVDTRRRIACELLKGLVKNYREQVKVLVSQEIQNMLAVYLANPTVNWKEKDCAVYLVISLASSDLVDVGSFFDNVILPELRSGDVNSQQILKADALKFFTTFRSQISKPTAVLLVPDLIRFLSSESNVVHSYAANCIEKLLLVNDDGRRRYTSGDIAPFLGPLMTNLFNVFRFPESEENQYAMKCIMRVFGVAEFNAEVSAACIAGLCSILNEVCKNPKNPIFNHYLFESVAALVRRGCERDLSMISVFEAGLFPILQQIMVNDITEFLPYALQIFAQMVEINRPPLSAIYLQLFDPLLSPQLWAKHANVPALVRLLQAYLQKASHELNREGRLTKVLEIFQNLVNSARTEEHGFYIVNTVIETVSYDVISPYVPHIWNALFTRLKMHRTVKFMKSFVILMCLFLVKHGHLNLVNSINSVQANIFNDIVERFWVPNLRLITGTIEVKLSLVASTMLLCESPAVVPDWGKMLDSIITLVSIPEMKRVEDEPDVPDIEETVGYSASFVSLYNAGRKDEDLVKEIRDPKEFLVVSLSRLSQSSPGKYPEIIKVSVDATKQQALRELCMTYNQQII